MTALAMTEVATFDLTFEGLVAAHAEPDKGEGYDDEKDYEPGDGWFGDTLRVHGFDVIKALDNATRGLRNPIRCQVTIDGHDFAYGRLEVERAHTTAGCGDPGCCGGYTPAVIKVGGKDVLEHLENLHRGMHGVRFYGQGYVPPIVQVQLAHHVHTGPVQGIPGDLVEAPLDFLLGIQPRMTPASWDRVMQAQRKVYDEHRALRALEG